jgi:hypothetical protein
MLSLVRELFRCVFMPGCTEGRINESSKPRPCLLPRDPTAEGILEFFRELTGRDPTPGEIKELRWDMPHALEGDDP